MDSFMEGAKAVLILVFLIGFVALCAKFAVTFRMKVPRPRGKDLDVTLQVKDIEAKDAKDAMHKAYETLSQDQKNQVTGVYLKRNDDE